LGMIGKRYFSGMRVLSTGGKEGNMRNVAALVVVIKGPLFCGAASQREPSLEEAERKAMLDT